MSEHDTTSVRVQELLGEELSRLKFVQLSGQESLDNAITNARVQKPGLAFAGYYDYIRPGRVQIIGESETRFLETLSAETRLARFEAISAIEVPVFIITKGLEPFPEFLKLCTERRRPVLSSPALSSIVIKKVSNFLEEHLVPSTHIHGVLLDVYGLGVLLIGPSGVGKSECALDLITRGHSLVADDRVTARCYPNGDLMGSSEGPLIHHMELRGLGIVNIQDLFGLAAVRERKSIDLVIELEPWDENRAYDRLGLDETVHHILDVPVPYIKMPVALGRNLSILVEVAARNHVLKLQGHHSAREFAQRLEERLAGEKSKPAAALGAATTEREGAES
ncbi:MAG: HPr(Ser) kinase/phosphatase [Acidobacteria bacterium]|nr:HPr(Ser) kinase/phosphatase [Acidobacteriota bacterium]